MNKTKNLLLALLLMCSTAISFAMENDDRYKVIAAAFDIKTNSFADDFFSDNNDILIIKKHSEQSKQTLNQYSKYTPLLLKTISIGFALESILMGLRGLQSIGSIYNTFMNKENKKPEKPKTPYSLITSFFDSMVNSLLRRYGIPTPEMLAKMKFPMPEGPEDSLLYYPKSILQTIVYPIDQTIIGLLYPIESKVEDMRRQKSITTGTYQLTGGAVLTATTLTTAGISLYLLNKANQYKNEMEKLEKEISFDEAMINNLEKQTR